MSEKPFYGTTRPGQPAHVALTIKGQIGIWPFAAVGAHEFSYIERPEPGLVFKAKIIPKGWKAARVMRVFVTLSPADTYNVKVLWRRNKHSEIETHFEAEGIYNDQLAEVIRGLDKEG